MIQNIHRLVNAAKISKIPTIFTREVHRPSMIDMGRELDGNEPRHCIDGTKGPVTMEELGADKLEENQFLVPKRRYSAFIGTDLIFLLNAFKADTLILTGAATNVCVHYTGADAHQYDYRIKVVEEATAGTSPEAHKAALEALEYLQNGALVHMGEVVEAIKAYVPSTGHKVWALCNLIVSYNDVSLAMPYFTFPAGYLSSDYGYYSAKMAEKIFAIDPTYQVKILIKLRLLTRK